MPTAENRKDLKTTADSPEAVAAELASEGMPPWASKAMDFLKKYQNVFYAIATVVLLTWAVLKFQARRKEEKINAAEFEFSQAQSVDALRGLKEKYAGLSIEPRVRLQIANTLLAEEKLDEAIKEFDELTAKFPETLAGKLAAQQSKTTKEIKAWSGKDGKLEAELAKLRLAEKTSQPPVIPTNRGPKIDDAGLPRIEVETKDGKVLIELDEDDAPNATASVIRQIEKLFYAKTFVYKVEKDAAVFFGDPMPDGSAPRGYTIPFETSKVPAGGGVVALERDLPKEGELDTDALKNTGSYRLVIFTGDVPMYAGKFLVIGRVVEGMDVVRKLAVKDEIVSARVVQKRSHPYEPKENPK